CVLERAHKESDVGVIAVTSATDKDGKTITAINLAGALALSPGTRVLLVDADLRRPSVARRLGIADSGGPGLAEALLDPGLGLNYVILPLAPLNLSVITAGRLGGASPYELFRSPRMGALLA